MKHKLFLNGKSYTHDGETGRMTHVLVGQRDEMHFDPRTGKSTEWLEDWMERSRNQTWSDEERSAWVEFCHRQTGGYFRLRPLAWCRSEAEAESSKAQFPEPEWINLGIREVDRVIVNG